MTVWDDDAQDPFERRRPDRVSADNGGVATTALIVIGIVGVLAWAWLALRAQLRGSQFPGFDDLSGIGLGERVDLFASSLQQLILPVAAIAVGRHLQRRAEPGRA